ncbi:RICIN domain-containing protein [Actinomadura barringtoniae]|uniref:RICIN domain-containing protein n=1 Tax=Actinomadura barringtoniae TaxID=1427535 RepID=A0A939PK13_9ACTN|nr:RICIN domain-containing protein [Actinomadura barringtoniae]MBO2454347.1 RICIN domain-containing protein [Actinomadura barringtoniae]
MRVGNGDGGLRDRFAALVTAVVAVLGTALIIAAACSGPGKPVRQDKAAGPLASLGPRLVQQPGAPPGSQSAPQSAPQSEPTPVARAERRLDDRPARYPRAVRLHDGRILVSVASTGEDDGVTELARFYESTDDGASFRPVSELRDEQATGGRGGCCGSMLELPGQMGAQPAGTLLWAWTVGMKNHAPGRRAELRVWRSTDGGRSWGYLSSCATAPNGTPWDRGLWEPELSIDSQGRLVCYFSDETQRGHDQVIAQTISTDGGATWGAVTTVVALGGGARPGMPVVRRLPNGTYVMSYEVCGRSSDACQVRYRTSADGVSWGDPGNGGTTVRTSDGKYLFHAPTITWVPGGGPDGRLLMVGGLLRSSDGKLSRPASGSTLLVNVDNAQGRWYEQPSPVSVSFSSRPEHDEVVCDNYSSALLPVANGRSLLEVATEADSHGTCRASFATSPLDLTPKPPKAGSYRVRNASSGLCLDGVGPGDTVQQLPCDDRRPRQKWTISGGPNMQLRNAKTGRCLGGACPGPGWVLTQVSEVYYKMTAPTGAACMQASGSIAAQSTCTGRATQLWRLEPR